MTGFFLGRSTPQWLSIITGTLGFFAVLIQLFDPEILPQYVVIAGSIGTLAGYYLAFLTNSGTTPTGDARLIAGQSLTLTTEAGTPLGSVTLPTEDEMAKDQPAARVDEDGAA